VAKPKKLKFELIRHNPNMAKKPWWEFRGNFRPFENIGLSRLHPNLGKKKRDVKDQLKIWQNFVRFFQRRNTFLMRKL